MKNRKKIMDSNMPKEAKDVKYSLPKKSTKGNMNPKIGKQIVPKN